MDGFRKFAGSLILLILACASCAWAQPAPAANSIRSSPNGGTVTGTVKDTTGAMIPGANVTLTDDSGGTLKASSGSDGTYTIRGLPPGTYSVSVTLPGLAQNGGVAISVSTGQIAHGDIIMRPAEVKQEVTVQEENPTQLGLQPSQNVDALVIKGTDLDALPDDPDDLQQDLQALAGPSAGPNGGEIYVDGFSSGRLPPKESIREIRINQNPFAPEFDKLGFGRIEIFTKPGSDKFHGTVQYDVSDGVWNARNPFITTNPIPSFLAQTYGGNVSGPLGKRASFFLDFERRQIDDNGILNAYDPTTFLLDRGFTPTPQQRTTFSPRVDYQLSTNNTLSMRYSYLDLNRPLWGVGLYNLPDNGYSYKQTQQLAQITETAVLSTSVVTETRFQFHHDVLGENDVSTDPQVIVPSTLDIGGQGFGPCAGNVCKGTTLTENNFELQNYTTVTHGKHTIKFGAREREDLLNYYTPTNFNGSFTFATFNAYEITEKGILAGLPFSQIQAEGGGPKQFTINTGNPSVSSSMFDEGAFIQDDWRATQRLTLSAGLRWEGQTNIHDWHDAAPRASFAWAPGKSNSKGGGPSLVFRGGFGMFYIRYPNANTLYTNEYNGSNQISYLVNNPSFFQTLSNGALVYDIPPLSSLPVSTNPSVRFTAGNGLRAPYLIQSALAVERQLNRRTTLTVNLTDTRGVHQFVTSDINAPLSDGLRPYGNIGDIYQYQSSGLLKQIQVISRINTQIGRRASLFGAYIWNNAHGNTDGTLCASSYGCGTSTPVNQYDLDAEWSRSSLDIENRMFLAGTVTAPWRLQFSPFITASSGVPFNITTGGDYLNDGILNARPAFASGPGPGIIDTPYGYLNPNPSPGEALIPRNLGTGPAQFTVNLRLSRTWGFGSTKFAGTSGGAHASSGGGPGGRGGGFGGFGGGGRGGLGGTTEHRFNLTASINARNLLNRANLMPPVGVMGSPFFLQSTGIAGGYQAEQNPTDNRRIDFLLRLQF
jgi:hypothetical protein